ncbi:MAG: SNF2-related protein, partial [Gemmatimonadaceae bacterium]
MERALTFAPPRTVRAAIARALLGVAVTPRALGDIVLRDHQRLAVDRLRVMLDERRCALLADAVGLGKTYVAAALAGEADRALVIGPAALHSMWTGALARAHVRADWISYETLSRGGAPRGAKPDLVVLDEAHHARTPSTRRYRAIAELVAGTRALFLSATPVHNHRHDLASLVALAVGSSAFTMSDAALARFVLRRERADVGADTFIPAVSSPRPV